MIAMDESWMFKVGDLMVANDVGFRRCTCVFYGGKRHLCFNCKLYGCPECPKMPIMVLDVRGVWWNRTQVIALHPVFGKFFFDARDIEFSIISSMSDCDG